MRPEVKYTSCDGVDIAYQVTGAGPIDIVYVPGWVSNLDLSWDYPGYARILERLGTFARLIRFDKRGTGLSERNVGFPTLEQRMEDVRAVMDAVGSDRAALLGTSEGGNMSMLFAATYPERTAALVLYGCFAKGVWAPDYPWAATREDLNKELEEIFQAWGGPFDLKSGAPSLANDPRAREWSSTYLRNSADRKSAIGIWDWNAEIDVRDILPAVHVPTLVLHRSGDRWQPVEEGRYLAEHIPGAKYVELPGNDHVIWAGDPVKLTDEIQEFLTGVRPAAKIDRVLMSVLFTDIVGSTAMASKLGDDRWNALVEAHNDESQGEITRHQGNLIKTTGDGVLAAFSGPTQAIHCATELQARLKQYNLEIRAAVHTGECERRETDLSGIAVHLCSRLLDHAGAGETVVSRTVRDLVVGSGIVFEERGQHELKGVPGNWDLFLVKDIEH